MLSDNTRREPRATRTLEDRYDDKMARTMLELAGQLGGLPAYLGIELVRSLQASYGPGLNCPPS